MKFTPETLMAYTDGELDTETRRQIEFAMATDNEVAEQIAKLKAQRLELQSAFAGMLDEPIPDRLIEAAKNTPAGTSPRGTANVTELAAVRAAKSGGSKRRWSWPEFTSMAATLLVGLVIGRNVLQSNQAIVANDGRLEASGSLAAALSSQASGDRGSAVDIGLSFKSKTGEYCRTFTLHDEAGVAGLACRDPSAWRVDALARAADGARSSDYRMAGAALPSPILRAVEEAIAGEALDADEEAEARKKGWEK